MWAFLICALLRFLSSVPFIIDDDEAWWSSSALWLKSPWDFYLKTPDDKTPGNVWFCWLVGHVFGNIGTDPRFIRAVYTVLTIGAALSLGKLAQHFYSLSQGTNRDKNGRIFWISSTLFLIATALPSPKLLAVTGDGLIALLMIVGFSIALLGSSLWRSLLAGAILGCALLVKQTAVFAAFPVLFSNWPKKWRRTEIALMLMGSLIVLIPNLYALGLSEFYYWVWVYPKSVLYTIRQSHFSTLSDLLSNLFFFGFALLPLTIAYFKFKSAAPRWFYDFRVQWLLSMIAAVAIGKGIFLHYFLLCVPPLVLILSEVYSRRAFGTWEKLWLGLGYAIACVLVTIPAIETTWGTDLAYFSRLNAAIADTLPSGEGVLVWGGSALPLIYSRMRPVTRFILPRYAVAPYGTERNHEIFKTELTQDPPAVVIDLHERSDNRFNNSIESEPLIANLAHHYHLYVVAGVPWVKLYFKNRPQHSAGLIAVKTAQMRRQVYAAYPARNPAWQAFEPALKQAPSAGMLDRLQILDSTLRMQHSLELVALQSPQLKTRDRAFTFIQTLKHSAGEVDPALKAEISHFLKEHSGAHDILPYTAPEWWVTVSLAQMQPR